MGAVDRQAEILWTGGFDSTFRVLQALIVDGLCVRPHYVIDPRRRTTEREQQACRLVRRTLASERPEVARRLLPTVVTHLDEIDVDDTVERRFESLNRHLAIGAQSRWLAAYARHAGLDALELCWERTPSGESVLVPLLLENSVGTSGQRRLRERIDHFELELMRPFRFPLLELSKQDMHRTAAEHGFAGLLELTWFCHSPRKGRPCGLCIPCEYTYEGGLRRRIPWVGRVRLRLAMLTGRQPTARRARRHLRRYGHARRTSADKVGEWPPERGAG